MAIVVGNAPVSWGIYEAHLPNPPYGKILDAIRDAGYALTELGPYGYLPLQADRLARELSSRGLKLGSSFVALPLEDAAAKARSIEHCLNVAALLATQGVKHLIVADDEDPARVCFAGRIPSDGSRSWSTAQWHVAGDTLNDVAWALKKRFGMKVVVHHHAGTFIETGEEIVRLMQETDPSLVGLLIDTGHATYGGADPVALLDRFPDRVWYAHYKDVKKDELQRVRTTGIAMGDAWKRGVFCALGQGVVDFAGFTQRLKARDWDGLVIVEQDVVPDAAGRLHPDPLVQARESRAYLRDTLGI